jgi:DNA-binding transcriptional regulator YdaS (Cro superfamily)
MKRGHIAPSPVQRAKTLCGGAAGLADKLNEINPSRPLTRQAVHQWVQVPAVRAVDVEAVSGIPRYELRPDVFRQTESAA